MKGGTYLGDVTMAEGKALAEMFPGRIVLLFQFESEKLKAYFNPPPKAPPATKRK